MIEAVNAVISNAPVLRPNAEQVSTLRSFTADAAAVESVARGPVAPYISPYISVDPRFDTAVLQLRDSDTGDVVTQFPSEPTLQARARAESKALETPRTEIYAQELQADAPQTTLPDSLSSVLGGQDIALVQQAGTDLPAPPQGAGQAQAAIVALSIGAQAGQVTPSTTVDVKA